MLDIYYIEDNSSKIPDSPDEKNYLNSMDIAQHRCLENVLKKCADKGIVFSFFDDSLLNLNDVEKMLTIFKSNKNLFENNERNKESYDLMVSG
jgi:hypothetical protein